jgi:hypothetical protein
MEGYTTTLLGRLRCEEQRRLMENFADTVKEVLALYQQQFDAAVHGDPDCTRFDQLIHMANDKKQEAKYAYLRHVEEHRCNRFDLVISRDRSGSAPTAEPKSAEAQVGRGHRQP